METWGARVDRVAGTVALRVVGVLLAGFLGAGLVAALTVLVGARLRSRPARVGWS